MSTTTVAAGQLWHQFVRPGVLRSVRVLSVENGVATVVTWLPDTDGSLISQPTGVETFQGLRLVETEPGIPA